MQLFLNFPSDPDDFNGMFPMSALLSHAELTKRKTAGNQPTDARRSRRTTRHGSLSLFPRVERAERIDTLFDATDQPQEPPRVPASISNVSTSGVGLIMHEELPAGLEFDVEWPHAKQMIPLRFEVVHSQPVSAGMYRTGARLVAGVLPEEPVPSNYVSLEQPDEEMFSDLEAAEAAALAFAEGVLAYEPDMVIVPSNRLDPAPPGTWRAASAFGFDKTETLQGVTTCGWDRSVSIRREGDRLWIYVHSPGKKNGWGLFVDAREFDAKLARVQQSATSPFVSTMAA